MYPWQIISTLRSIFKETYSPNNFAIHIQTPTGSKAVTSVRVLKGKRTGDIVVVLEADPEDEVGTATSSG